ncbi:MarR family winged helix-turn-helix transcriptional regulator [Salipaludibacillus sp. LMS25]|uniref:MarR family winged helix-turn-helix transcriptional regulator n=1 Tax=Salipaludibacillus sp. LMS25 TaxID=2924031 RepID=UPI0034E94C5C
MSTLDQTTLFNQFVTFTTAVHRVTHDITKNVKADHITPLQYNILEYLYVSQPVTPTDISECHDLSMPNTSRELKKLTEKWLIEKVEDPLDRRKRYVQLSSEGKSMMKDAFDVVEAHFQKRIKDATDDDLHDIEKAIITLQNKLFY